MDFPRRVPGAGLVNGEFVNEDPVHGVRGSLIPAEWGNAVTKELLSVIEAAGIAPDEGVFTQLVDAIRGLIGQVSGDGGLVVFDTPGIHTWNVPDVLKQGVKKPLVFVTAPGGGGSGYFAGSSPGTFGGAGGTAIGRPNLAGVTSVPITIPALASGGNVGESGATGGSCSFGSYLSAVGGQGGLSSGFGGVGGEAYGVGLLLVGGKGSMASLGGKSGGSFWGGGSAAGQVAGTYGTGGSPPLSNGPGSPGASAVVLICW